MNSGWKSKMRSRRFLKVFMMESSIVFAFYERVEIEFEFNSIYIYDLSPWRSCFLIDWSQIQNFFQTFISIISCMASVAALAIIVIIFLRELPEPLPPPLPQTPTTTTPITSNPNCSINETSSTTTHQHISTSNIFLSCRKEIEWSPVLMKKKFVFENGTFQDTTVVGEFVENNNLI